MVVKGLGTLIVGLIQEFLRGRGANFDSQKAFLSGSAMLWFNFILGSNFIFLCFKLIIIHYNTQKTKEHKIWTKDKIEPQHIHVQV